MSSLFLTKKYDEVMMMEYREAAYLSYSRGLLTWDELVEELRGIEVSK